MLDLGDERRGGLGLVVERHDDGVDRLDGGSRVAHGAIVPQASPRALAGGNRTGAEEDEVAAPFAHRSPGGGELQADAVVVAPEEKGPRCPAVGNRSGEPGGRPQRTGIVDHLRIAPQDVVAAQPERRRPTRRRAAAGDRTAATPERSRPRRPRFRRHRHSRSTARARAPNAVRRPPRRVARRGKAAPPAAARARSSARSAERLESQAAAPASEPRGAQRHRHRRHGRARDPFDPGEELRPAPSPRARIAPPSAAQMAAAARTPGSRAPRGVCSQSQTDSSTSAGTSGRM